MLAKVTYKPTFIKRIKNMTPKLSHNLVKSGPVETRRKFPRSNVSKVELLVYILAWLKGRVIMKIFIKIQKNFFPVYMSSIFIIDSGSLSL